MRKFSKRLVVVAAGWFSVQAAVLETSSADDAGTATPAAEGTEVLVVRDTFFKAQPVPSADLPEEQKCRLEKGQAVRVVGEPSWGEAGHLKVTLAGTACVFSDGFFFAPHVAIDMEQPPPGGERFPVLAKTWLKARPVDSAELNPNEKCALEEGQVLTLAGKPESGPDNHLHVAVLSRLECDFQLGYVYAPHLVPPAPPGGGAGPQPPPPAAAGWGERFAGWYAANYRQVYNRVMALRGTTTDSCAAFASTALAGFGLNVPYMVWAPSLRSYVASAGFVRITDPAAIRPGDVAFTQDSISRATGETGHVFVVQAVSGRLVYAIDNQGNGNIRNIYEGESPFKWGVWDAYRWPAP